MSRHAYDPQRAEPSVRELAATIAGELVAGIRIAAATVVEAAEA